jgi:octanoyl-[GcvH]:protein N-octanoyltransferase
MADTGGVPDDGSGIAQRLLVEGRPQHDARSAIADLVVPAVLLRAAHTDWSELVHVYTPHGPTVAFSSRDIRSPGLHQATAIARDAGFDAVVRSPGGRMVAYDDGAVVIDHLTRPFQPQHTGGSTFADNAESHADVLRSLGDIDARVGEVEGEYCPGEYSVNVGGRTKVIGSAQRIIGNRALFSTVVQSVVSDRVRDVIVAVSEALGYELSESSIAGLADYAPALTAGDVAAAFASDYRRRLVMTDAHLEPNVLNHAATATALPQTALPFDVNAWTRAHPLTG